MAKDQVGEIGQVTTKAQPTAAPQQTRPAATPEGSLPAQAANNGDRFTPSQDVEDDKAAEEGKKKADAQEDQEAEKQAEEQKKKELEQKIADKTKELEQARKDGDQKKIASLTKDLDGLQNELEALLNQAAQQQPQAVPATGSTNAPNLNSWLPAPQGQGVPATGGGNAPAPAVGRNQSPPTGNLGAPPTQNSPYPMGSVPSWAPPGSRPANPPEGGWSPPQQPATGPIPQGRIIPNGTGQDAVNLGKQYLGRASADIKGALPNFTAAGGRDNNCADFVSACLESTGRIKGHHVNVREMQQALLAQGYQQVPQGQAQPGDVWINSSVGHTQLVASAGGTQLLGSNNVAPDGSQVISLSNNPQGGFFYHLPSP